MRKSAERNPSHHVNALAFVVVALAFSVMAPAASADITIGTPGPGPAQYKHPTSIAVDNSNGHLYLADHGNRRIDVFDSAGNFIRAFGWGVADGTNAELQTCTSTCFAGIFGSGAGQFKAMGDIAVDNDPASPSYHDVYVVDAGNTRIQKFDPSGNFILMFGGGVNKTTGKNLCTAASGNTCGAGSEGTAAGQFGNSSVRPHLALGTGGLVYVSDGAFVESVPKTGETVTDNRIQKFDPSGTFVSQISLADNHRGINAFAVVSTGDFYTASSTTVRKYDPSGNILISFQPPSSGNILGLATDSAGDLFVAAPSIVAIPGTNNGLAIGTVSKFNVAGTLQSVFYGAQGEEIEGLTPFHTAAADIFTVSSGSESGVGSKLLGIPFPAPGPVVPGASELNKAAPVGNIKATLNAYANPEGKATTYHFQYIDDAHFKSEGGFASSHTVTTPESASVGSDFKLHLASFSANGLTPETTYHFRLLATNVDGADTGPEATFKTLAPLELGDTWSTDVGTDSATLHAEANPLGTPATGHFQYVDDATYREDIDTLGPGHGFDHASDAPDAAHLLDFGSGEKVQTRGTPLYPLASGTTYHYRFILADSFATITGEEHVLRTYRTPSPSSSSDPCPNAAFRTGAAAALTDCRAYELVTPLEKGNADVTVDPEAIDQASPDGEALTYSAPRAFANPQSAPFFSQYIAARHTGKGWSSRSISPPRTSVFLYHSFFSESNMFKAFSDDLCSAWDLYDIDAALAPGAPPGVPNLYRRRNCGEEGYELITSTSPPGFNPELESPATAEGSQYFPEIQGFSADGARSVFRADAALTPDANKKENFQLYESDGNGNLRLLSVLPNGKAATTNSSAGTAQSYVTDWRGDSVYHAVSADGSRVFWTTTEASNGRQTHGEGDQPGKLYLRLNALQPPSKISGGKCSEAEKACTVVVSESVSRFWSADREGTRAIYTTGALSGAVLGGEASLYEFDLNAEPPSSGLIAGEVAGVMGTSEDGSHVYFLSNEALAAGASAGKPNLYIYSKGAGFTFIATIAGFDSQAEPAGLRQCCTIDHRLPSFRNSRVSADGLHAAFVSSDKALSELVAGYDNADAASGQPNAEVYLYDATANGGTGELHCVSCNPSGARPWGREVRLPGNPAEAGRFAAAQLPGWMNQLHPGRLLSADGQRLFFESFEPLVLGDTNGKADVYEWEAPGSGDCTNESPSYSPPNDGCLSLISSGKSPADSQIVDASASGSDVFFATDSSLLPQDYGLRDIYDARVNGGFPQPPPPPPSCEGEACQSAVVPPNDPTPASSAFDGAGNVQEGVTTKPRCAKGKARRKGRCVVKKHQKRGKRPQRRAANPNRRAGR
jgi:hypothetical protein